MGSINLSEGTNRNEVASINKLGKSFLGAKFLYYTNIIIFDWDDTLMCTSYLSTNGLLNEEGMKVLEADQDRLLRLEKTVYSVLSLAISNGQTYIVTNAGPGWVEYSIAKLFPSLEGILKDIKILSARGLYEHKYPNNPVQWKVQTFLDIHKAYAKDINANIVCIGDSENEIEAGNILSKKFGKAFLKTIKFKESPRIEELIKQNRLVFEQFEGILGSLKNLAIRVEKKNC
jgi:hypothetical protein